MSHHTLVARLGADDKTDMQFSRLSTHMTELNFLRENGTLAFGLGQALKGLRALGLTPSDTSVDLAILAATVTAADTRISRVNNAQDLWTREIALHVPVATPAVWNSQTELLSRMLNFLTGDRWTLHFRLRPELEDGLIQQSSVERLMNPTSVCLFSGGLDSFIGAIDLISNGGSPLLISHYWDTTTSIYQQNCARLLSDQYGQVFSHVRARVGFEKTTFEEEEGENTLRGRSFMFFSLATMAADALEGPVTINVPENGLISLNVPLDPLRVGALSTRTTHPFYMARYNELLGNLGINARLDNPYAYKTKGEMALQCNDRAFLRQHAGDTMSCSSPQSTRWDPTLNDQQSTHCGRCVPCLIRRASLFTAFGTDDTIYRIPNLRSRVLDSSRPEGEHVRAFQFALEKLMRSPGRARFDVHKPGPLSDYPNRLDDYEGVYLRGMGEVERLLSGVITRPLT
ncbi:Qat anti-phage system QueC-like protein QatC (plasmid) [Pantoea agglomerans]|uniref:Qat anti-phage system QueC-like protein QatC n=1 Tax=Enterobacter agglomerans TaxID=549 RepID=UPI002D78CA60|nr:Qat anti-phage system QueC-like protein QatC [Pantoea agglomerans]WRO92155.1 Qat anti-phage system QueC-like protein QatC [Pantoea agglomerans]